MTLFLATSRLTVAVLVAAVAAGAHAEHRKVVGDNIINIGVVPARAIAGDPAEQAQHGDGLRFGGQHVVVSLADAASGKAAPDADVRVRVVDPKGRVEERRLVPGAANGVPDYSGVFSFGWSGAYRVQVRATAPAAKVPLVADFTLTHLVQ